MQCHSFLVGRPISEMRGLAWLLYNISDLSHGMILENVYKRRRVSTGTNRTSPLNLVGNRGRKTS